MYREKRKGAKRAEAARREHGARLLKQAKRSLEDRKRRGRADEFCGVCGSPLQSGSGTRWCPKCGEVNLALPLGPDRRPRDWPRVSP